MHFILHIVLGFIEKYWKQKNKQINYGEGKDLPGNWERINHHPISIPILILKKKYNLTNIQRKRLFVLHEQYTGFRLIIFLCI